MSDRTATWPPQFTLYAWTTVGDCCALAAKHKGKIAGIGGLAAAALWSRYPRLTARGRVRASLQPHIERLQEYGQGRGASSYYCVFGPKAAGKSSTTHAAFGGWHGVHRYEVSLNVDEIDEVNLRHALAGPLGLVGLGDMYGTHLSVMNRLCNIFLRRDFVAVLNLVDKQGELSDAQVLQLAGEVSGLGRSLTHDNGICKLVVETSVPKLGDAIAVREGSICHKVHVLPMSLEDFKECFAEYVLADKDALFALDYTPTAPPKARWFGPTDKDREAYTAWASKLLSCKLKGGGPGITTVEDLATEYFYKVGPDVRRLADLVGGKAKLTFAESMCCFGKRASTAGHSEINDAHNDLKKKLKSLTAEESQVVAQLVAAGPRGCLPKTRDDTKSKFSLLERPTSGTLVRKIHSHVTLHYVGHVYALLMQEHKNDDAKVRTLMKQYGWVDMVNPRATAA